MKVYLVFKLKDPKSKKKEFIVDSVHTSVDGAAMRESRLHKGAKQPLNFSPTYKTDKQETYTINKTLKGQYVFNKISDYVHCNLVAFKAK